MTPEAVHELGIDGVQRVQREMEAIMRRTGFDGSLQEFFRYMRTDPRFYYENTESGRAAYLERARGLVEEVSGRVEDLVYEPPTVALEVRRFEAYREKSAPGAFYEAAPEGGKRPAVFYVNLHDMAGVPVYELDSLVYHETIPGHHLQISAIRADPDIPTLRKLNVWWLNSAFVEGWALYAERLAAEIGLYGDPYADIRGFHDAVLRHGFVPLTVMEESVATWTEEVLARSGRGRRE